MTIDTFVNLVSLYPEPFIFVAIGSGIFLADIIFTVVLSPFLEWLFE